MPLGERDQSKFDTSLAERRSAMRTGASGEPRSRRCGDPYVGILELDLVRGGEAARTRLRTVPAELQAIYADETLRANGSSEVMFTRSPIGISWRRAIVGAVIVLAVAASTIWFASEQRDGSTLELIAPKGTFVVETARTAEARATGLSNRTSIAHEGLLLVWDAPGSHPIWMVNMKFALDLVWLDANGRVLAVLENVPPCEREPCPLYEPPGSERSTSVLEAPAGHAARYAIAVGSVVRRMERDRAAPSVAR